MADRLEEIQILLQKRNARSRGQISSSAYNDTIDEISHDLANFDDQWNNRLVPLTSTIPNGTDDSTVDAFSDGLDGRTLYTNSAATSSAYTSYYNSVSSRPMTVYEQFVDVLARVDALQEDLEGQLDDLISSAAQVSIIDSGSLYDSEHVEGALAEVMTQVNLLTLGSLDLSAVAQDYLPATDIAYDIGSATKRIKSLYLSGSSLHINSKVTDTGTPPARDYSFSVNTSTGDLELMENTTVIASYNGTTGVDFPLGGGSLALNDITDVSAGSPSSDDVLQWNGANWENAALSFAAALDDLTDVTLSAPTSGQALKYNGVGWVNDTDEAGTVNGSGSVNKVSFWTGANTLSSDTDLHWDNSNKRLGIGAVTPARELDVSGRGRFKSTTANVLDTIRDLGAATSGFAQIGSFWTETSVASGSTLTGLGGFLSFGNIDSTSSHELTRIGSRRESASADHGRLLFATSSGGTPSEKMTILSDGKVGIGTDTPAGKLEVKDDGTSASSILFVRQDDHSPYGITVNNTTASASGRFHVHDDGTYYLLSDPTKPVGIGRNTGGGSTDDFRITADGDVGIGDTTPAEKLQVNGAVIVGAASGTTAGAIQWTGSNFQGYTGSAWVDLDDAGGAGTVTASSGADNRIATFTTGTNIEGDADLTWDQSLLHSNTTGFGEKFRLQISGSTIFNVEYQTPTETVLTGGSGSSLTLDSGTGAVLIGSKAHVPDISSALHVRKDVDGLNRIYLENQANGTAANSLMQVRSVGNSLYLYSFATLNVSPLIGSISKGNTAGLLTTGDALFVGNVWKDSTLSEGAPIYFSVNDAATPAMTLAANGSLSVGSNFSWTESSKHFFIDSALNGTGPFHFRYNTSGTTEDYNVGTLTALSNQAAIADTFGPFLSFQVGDTGANSLLGKIGFVRSDIGGGDGDGRFVIIPANAGSAALTGSDARQFNLLPDGKVGIGTASPSRMLQVQGDDNSILGVASINNGSAGTSAAANLTIAASGASMAIEAFSTSYVGNWPASFDSLPTAGTALCGPRTANRVFYGTFNTSGNAYMITNNNIVTEWTTGGDVLNRNGIRIGSTTDTTAGNMRWDGSNFQGYNGSAWVALDTQGAPGGSTTQLQYNNAGAFGGASAMVYVTGAQPKLQITYPSRLVPLGSAVRSTMVGDGASAFGADCTAYGYGATCNSLIEQTVMGSSANSSSHYGTVYGYNSDIDGNSQFGMAIGHTANVDYSTYGIAIGYLADLAGTSGGGNVNYAIALGNNATVGAWGAASIAIGLNATIGVGTGAGVDSTQNAIAIGVGAQAASAYATILGAYAGDAGAGYLATCLGGATDATGVGSTAVGYASQVLSDYSSALGYASKSEFDYSLALGFSAETTASGQMMVGDPNYPMDIVTYNGITIGDSVLTNEGTIRYNGTDFEGYTVSGWQSITDSVGGGGGGASTLDDLTDVSLTAPASGEYLSYNGSDWENVALAGGDAGAPDYTVTDVVSGVLTPSLGEVVRTNPAGGGFTVTLPLSTAGNKGEVIIVKNTTTSTNTLTIDTTSSQLIDGASSATIEEAHGARTFVSYGDGWGII